MAKVIRGFESHPLRQIAASELLQPQKSPAPPDCSVRALLQPRAQGSPARNARPQALHEGRPRSGVRSACSMRDALPASLSTDLAWAPCTLDWRELRTRRRSCLQEKLGCLALDGPPLRHLSARACSGLKTRQTNC